MSKKPPKEAIVNSPSILPITHANNKCLIKGYGNFHKDQIVSASGQRFVAAKLATLTFTVPTTASMGLVSGDINKAVSVLLRVNTSRYASEWATDFIKRGRPFVFELVLNYADNQATIATKLLAAFAAYESKFNLSPGLPFYYTGTGATISLQAKAGHLSFGKQVTFLLARETYGSVVTGATAAAVGAVTQTAGTANVLTAQGTYTGTVAKDYVVEITAEDTADVFRWSDDGGVTWTAGVAVAADPFTNTLSNGVTITFGGDDNADGDTWTFTAFPATVAGDEANVDGKYLEETVRMSNDLTDGAYVLSPGERPDITASYTTIKFRMKATESNGIAQTFDPHAHMGTGVGNISTDAYMDFVLYFNEASCIETGGPVDTLIDFLITGAPVIGTFLKASGSGASSVADFIA
jgi:hypothetical protein